MPGREKQIIKVGIFSLLAIFSVVGFHNIGQQYLEYRLMFGMGTIKITANELVFYLWYFVLGLSAVAFLSLALNGTVVPKMLQARFESFFEWRYFPAVLSVIVLCEVLLFQSSVLQYAPVTDDESVYAFIAKTLLGGAVVNQSPGDIEFFKNQFIIINESHWYGKYPIGHPLLLAVGELIGLRFLVIPLLSALTFYMTFLIGCQLFSRKAAAVGLLLLMVSPHFVFMGASELSQPTASLFMVLGLWSLNRMTSRPGVLWPALAGLFFGYGLLVRPMPGAFFVVASGLWVLFGARELTPKARLKGLAVGAVPILVFGLLLLWINEAQSGSVFTSGYQADHATTTGDAMSAAQLVSTHHEGAGQLSLSFFGALVRENFWLFGWPVSLFFVFFLKIRRRLLAFGGLIAGAFLYRIVFPKTCVATLGPVYLTEIVPLLALASAVGIFRIKEIVSRIWGEPARTLITSIVLASVVVSGLTFLPVQLRAIGRSSDAWHLKDRLLEKAASGRLEKRLVFADLVLYPPHGNSWAGNPPNPSPSLDDNVIFVRRMKGADGPSRNIAFWKRRFPDRSAWLFGVGPEEAYIREIKSAEDFFR